GNLCTIQISDHFVIKPSAIEKQLIIQIKLAANEGLRSVFLQIIQTCVDLVYGPNDGTSVTYVVIEFVFVAFGKCLRRLGNDYNFYLFQILQGDRIKIEPPHLIGRNEGMHGIVQSEVIRFAMLFRKSDIRSLLLVDFRNS